MKLEFSWQILEKHWNVKCGPGSSVGIATELRAGRSGFESRWGRDLPPVQTGPGAHPASCKMGTGSFPGVKCGRGVLLTTHPLLVPRSGPHRACYGNTLPSETSNVMKIRPVRAELFPFRRTDMTMLILSFRSFANASDTCHFKLSTTGH